ncbi:MAG: hypothetical protein NC541_05615 [bacterium]|nr:hypothetical protein [bacterium]
MSIPMALVDFIPVILFVAGAVVLQREFYDHMSKGTFAVFSAGTITVFMAGLFKACWKLLYAAGICDFTALNECFFPMQTTGFVLAALGMTAMLCGRRKKAALYSVGAVPAVYSGTMLFVALMVLGVAVLDGGLIVMAVKRKKKAAVAVFLVSFVFVLGMGYLSSKDFADPAMNWMAEGVNIVGQGAFLAGALMIREKREKGSEG